MLPIKSSPDDDPGFKYGFWAEASLPVTQGAPAVSHNTTRLIWMVFALYECHIHSDVVKGESPSLVKNVEIEFEIKPQHQISIGNISVDQPFLTHCSHRSPYFSNL